MGTITSTEEIDTNEKLTNDLWNSRCRTNTDDKSEDLWNKVSTRRYDPNQERAI